MKLKQFIFALVAMLSFGLSTYAQDAVVINSFAELKAVLEKGNGNAGGAMRITSSGGLANATGTATLGANIVLEGVIEIPDYRELTLELNGKTISGDDSKYIRNLGSFTILDEVGGGVIACPIYNGTESYKEAYLEIQGGTFKSLAANGAAVTNYGESKISAGRFFSEYTALVNCNQMVVDGGAGQNVYIEGKTYSIRNSSVLDVKNAVIAGTADSYFAEDNAATATFDNIKYYNVVVNGQGYTSLQEAVDAAAGGDLIRLFGNIEESSVVTINKAITLDGNGKKFTTTAANAIKVAATATVNIKDITVEGATDYALSAESSVTVTGSTLSGGGAVSATAGIITLQNTNLVGTAAKDVIYVASNVIVNLEKGSIEAADASGNYYVIAGADGCTDAQLSIMTDDIDLGGATNYVNLDTDKNTVKIKSTHETALNEKGYATEKKGISLTVKRAVATVKSAGNVYKSYTTFAAALDAVQNGETINILNVTGTESGELDFTKDIEFTITGSAPNYALPVVTFQNAKVNIENAEILIPELDARQNAVINVVSSTVHDAGGNSIVKSYYNGEINIDANSTVYAMQVTTMGYINVKGTLNATWQTNVYGNGMITVEDGATFNTAGLNLIAKEYSGRDNTDPERVGKPATIIVDGATFTVGKVYSESGADYSYNADGYGINVGTIEGKNAVLDIKNGATVNIYTGNGKTANIGANGTVNVAASTLNVACRDAEGTATLANAGTVYVTGASNLAAAKVTGAGWFYMNGVSLDADTKLLGAKVGFINGENTVKGSTIENGWFSVGIGQDAAAAAAATFAQANGITLGNVTVNVSDNAVVGSAGSTYSGWVGSAYSADKAKNTYTLNINSSLAAFGYMHVSKDGTLTVDGRSAADNRYTYDNANVNFYAGDFIVNGVVTLNNADAWVKFTKMSVDHVDGILNINGDTKFESSIHNGGTSSTSLKFWKAGNVNVAKTATVEIDNGTVLVEGAKLNIAGNVTAKGAVTGNGAITLTDTEAVFTAQSGLNVSDNNAEYFVQYKEGAYKLYRTIAVIGDVEYASLQEAINACVTGDNTNTITLVYDVTEDVTVAQAPNVKITIEGADKTFAGTITVNGKSARYETAALTVKNVNFDAREGITYDACVRLGDGTNNTRYTNNVTIDGCTFTDDDYSAVAVKSYTGGDYNLQIINCTAEGMHSLAQLANVEKGLVIKGNNANTKNGINLNRTYSATISDNTINVQGYAVRAGVNGSTGGKITLTNNTLTTDNSEGDPVIVLRGSVDALNMTENVVSGDTHIKGTAATVSVDANYWDGKDAPVADPAVRVNSYYADAAKSDLVRNHFGGSIVGYTTGHRIWGDAWGNAFESYKVIVLDAEGNEMGTTELNNVGGIIDGDVNVTWGINFVGSSNDPYWTWNWTTRPSINKMPAKVQLWIDGVNVGEGPVMLNAPDNLAKIVAATTDVDGNITACYTSLNDACANGDNVAILVAGTYNVPTGKNLTITGAVDGVEFGPITEPNMGMKDYTFNNVTFNYAADSHYKGLQYAGNMVYNNCTFNGQVFLYGVSETFNSCTFNQENAAYYNVWTYSAKDVDFNECTFNSAGKSVLVYHEGAATFNDVTVTKSTFKASQTVEGKAAIEIDTQSTAGAKITIDGETTATGFDAGNVSGNSLWNNKMANTKVEESNDITVVVDGDTVLEPVYTAQIGEKKYKVLDNAIKAVKNNEEIVLLADCDANIAFTQTKDLSFVLNGNDKTMTGSINITARAGKDAPSTLVIKNFNFKTNETSFSFIESVEKNYYPNNITIEDCTFEGPGGDNSVVAVNLKSANNITIKNCTGTGLHSFLQNNYAGWNLTIDNVDVSGASEGAFALGTVQGVTVKNCTIEAGRYGIRLDAQYNNNAVIEGNSVKAYIPVVVRKASVVSNYTFKGENTMTQTNTDGYWMVIGVNEYGKDGQGLSGLGSPAAVKVVLEDTGLSYAGVYGNFGVATVNGVNYNSLADALAAANDGETVILNWAEGNEPIAMAGTVCGNKTVTITGTAEVDWDKGWLYVGRNGEGNGKLIFREANLTSKSVGISNNGIGLNVSCKKDGSTDTNDGEVEIIDSHIQLDYLIGKGNIKLDNSTLNVYEGFAVGARPASETAGQQRTVTMDITNGSNVVVNNHNGQGLGYEANGVMNIDATSTFETTQSFLVTANGTMNVNGGNVEIAGTLTNDGTMNVNGGTVVIPGTLTNNGAIKVTGEDAAKLNIANLTGNAIVLENGNLVDSNIAGRVNAFGTNNISGTTVIGGILSLGYETNPTEQVVVNITGNFNGSNVVVSTNNSVDNLLNVGTLSGERTTAHFGQLGGFADISINNTDVTYGYAFIRNDLSVNNSTLAIKGGVNTYIAGNAKVVIDNSTWNLSGYANIGSYGGYMYGNADVTLKNSSVMTATNMGVELSSNKVVNFTIDETSTFNATKLTNQGTINVAGTVNVNATTVANTGVLTNQGTINVAGTVNAETVANTGVINFTEETATLKTTTAGLAINENIDNKVVIYVDGTYKFAAAVAEILGTTAEFYTLAEAVEAAEADATVVLLDNATGAGVVINKNLTIDFAEFTYTFNEGVDPGVYIVGGDVSLTNGTLNGANTHVVISNNGGSLLIDGETDVTAGAIALSSSNGTIEVKTTGAIAGTLDGNVKLYSGTYNYNVKDYCATGYAVVDNHNGTFNVEQTEGVVALTIVHEEYEGEVFENQNVKHIQTLTYTRNLEASGKYLPFCLPFEIPVTALGDDYSVAYFNNVHAYDNDEDGVIEKMTVEVITIKTPNAILRANTPYLIKANSEQARALSIELTDATLEKSVAKVVNMASASVDFTVGGVYSYMSGADVLSGINNDDAKCFYPWAGAWYDYDGDYNEMVFSPFEVYLTMAPKADSPFIISEEAMQSIETRVVGEEFDGTTYIYDVVIEDGEEVIYDLQGRRVNDTEKGIYIKGGKKVLVK